MRSSRPPPGPRVVLYEDLNCPFCYALTETLETEGLTGVIEWRGVQHAPRAAVPWAEAGPALRQLLDSEVETVRRRAPALSIVNPTGQPNTAYAITAIARVDEESQRAAVALRVRIKRALFRQNLDISDPQLVARIQRELGIFPAEADESTRKRVAGWQQQWVSMRPRMIPSMIAPDGEIRLGLGDLSEAVAFVRRYAGQAV